MHDIISGNYDIVVQAAAGLAYNAGMVVSANTIHYILKENRLYSVQKIKKLMLSLCHCNACMEFTI
jgi:hypothetical protein